MEFSGKDERTNKSLQADEIEALSSIFGEEFAVEDAINRVYSILITSSSGNRVYFQVKLPETYPLHAPPIYQISAPWMSRSAKIQLSMTIENVYCENIGESIIYLWIEAIRDFIELLESSKSTENPESPDRETVAGALHLLEETTLMKVVDELPPVEHGEPIIDRKSVFQAHVAKIVTVEQVKQVLEKLRENKKIATATHNIYAYRIAHDSHGSFLQDCEDDGEAKAGSVLLHLLQILGMENVLVVVSRWYGGIHLGPDRFKHISNAARNALCKFGFVKGEKSQSGTRKSRKK